MMLKLTSKRNGLSRLVSEAEVKTMRKGYEKNNLGKFDDLWTVEEVKEETPQPEVVKKPRKAATKKEEDNG